MAKTEKTMRAFDLFEQQAIDAAVAARERQKAQPKLEHHQWFHSQSVNTKAYLNKQAQVADCYTAAQRYMTERPAYAADWMDRCAEHLAELKEMKEPEWL